MKVIDEVSLPRLLAAAAELGTMSALVNCGLVNPKLTKRNACLLYGGDNIDQWLTDGMLEAQPPKRKGGQATFDRLTLEVLHAAKEVAEGLEDFIIPFNTHFPN